MGTRRDFIKGSLALAGAVVAGNAVNAGRAEAAGFPPGLVYTKDAPGRWAGKEALHAPVVTLGPRTAPGDLVEPEASLRARGVEVVRTDRGGGVTFHGPGQLVAYPVLDLRSWGLGPRDYLRFLESLVAGVLGDLGVEGVAVEGRTGVWAGGAKVCAIGVRVAGGVSMHGFALNVSTALEGFGSIVPCGIRDAGVTSLARLLPRAPSVEEVADLVEAAFLREAALRGAGEPCGAAVGRGRRA